MLVGGCGREGGSECLCERMQHEDTIRLNMDIFNESNKSGGSLDFVVESSPQKRNPAAIARGRMPFGDIRENFLRNMNGFGI